MRVLLNTKPMMFSHKTGVGYYVLNLYRELRKAGLIVVPTLEDASITFIDSLSKLSAPLRSLLGKSYPAFSSALGNVLFARLLKKKPPAAGYDLYHETSTKPMPAIKTKTICNLYDLSFIRCPEFFLEDFAKDTAWSVKRNLSVADRIIVNTEFIKNDVMSLLKLPAEKIDVIPLASSANYYRLDKQASRLEEVERFTAKPYVLYVGTVEPRKNLKTLMKAFTEIKRKYDLSLVIAGGLGWLYEDVLSFPEKLGIKGDVIFTNYTDEKTLLYLYNYASVFVYPSFYEGFGIPPLEAMSCGAPVIISDIPPLKEVAGDAALTFKPDDHEQLAHLMATILTSDSLRSAMREKGIRRAREYSWQKVAGETIKTYQRALTN